MEEVEKWRTWKSGGMIVFELTRPQTALKNYYVDLKVGSTNDQGRRRGGSERTCRVQQHPLHELGRSGTPAANLP